MKTWISLFFFFFICVLQAQNWQQICFPGRSLYSDSTGNIKVTEFSLSVITVGDTVFYSFPTIGYHAGFNCADSSGGSLMGIKIHKLSTGWVHFFNHNHDTVYLNTMASLNSSWRFGKIDTSDYLQATVTALGINSVFGQSDSVKTISLQAKNSLGQNISHPLNNSVLVLSKHFGLTELINLNDFPDNATSYILAGRSQDSLGMQEISGAEIYDFDIGDQFHYITQESYVHYIMESEEIETVTDKQILSPGLIRYNMHSCILKIERVHPFYEPDTSWLSNDYITDINIDSVNQLIQFTAAPDEFIPYMDSYPTSDKYYWKNSPVFNFRSFKSYTDHAFERSDPGCWMGSLSCDYEYAQGLGNTKINYYFGTGVFYYKDLVYYKKGNESYGNPIGEDCSTLFSISEMPEVRAMVVPNPFRSSATITYQPLRQVSGLKIRITDITGRKVLEDDFLPPDYMLDRGALRSGTYLMQIMGTEGNPLVTSKLIID